MHILFFMHVVGVKGLSVWLTHPEIINEANKFAYDCRENIWLRKNKIIEITSI